MKVTTYLSHNLWSRLPPWVVAGICLVLFPLVGFATFNTIQKQKENTYLLLLEKGAALIRAFEAGTRTAVATPQWQSFQLQGLLQETAMQPDIRYLFVVRENGTVIAHSDPGKVGFKVAQALMPHPVSMENQDPDQIRNIIYWRVRPQQEGAPPIFEVYRPFLPDSKQDSLLQHRMRLLANLNPAMAAMTRIAEEKLTIFVGLDMHSVEETRISDMWHSLLMGGMMLLVGFTGIVFVILFQTFQLTRKSLSTVRAFSSQIVESMPVGLVTFNSRLLLKEINSFAEKLLDLASPEPGTPASDLLPSPLFDFIALGEKDQRSFSADGFYKEIQWEAGERSLSIGATISHLDSPAGNDSESGNNSIILLIRDLSEIDSLRKEIVRNQRLATVGKLAAGIAHEIRNPLSSIKGFATLFRDRHADNPEESRIADIMIQEVDRLNRVVGQLLDFSKPLLLSMRRVHMREFFRNTLRLIGPLGKGTDIRVRNEIPDDLYMRIDEDHIQQIVLNLFLNAIDAMKTEGTLTISAYRSDKSVRILVRDTGKGIEESVIPHIFDPYFTTKATGTGLGLAIAHNIMDAHGGSISVGSVVGQGTTFTLTFPGKDTLDAPDDSHS